MPTNGPRHKYDALGGLLPLTWRGIEVPCYRTSLSVSNRLTEHNQYLVAGGYQENGGRGSGTFPFTMLLRNGIAGYENLYPGVFRDMLNALYDPSEGELGHPEFGPLTCKVATFDVQWDVSKRDGADIAVTFKEHNAGLEDAELNLDASALGEAVNLEITARELDVEFDDGSGSSLADILSGLQGRLAMAQLDVANAIIKIEGAIAGVNNMIDALESITDPKAWGVADAAKRILMALGDTLANLTPDKRKRVALKVSDQRQPVSKAAGKWGMSTEEFLQLNPRTALTGYLEAEEEFFVFEVS